MKYAFLLTCLLTGTLYLSAGAQDKEEDLKRKTTRTEYNFNLQPYALNHRHETNLGNGNKMIIELFDANDYDLLQNTDSLFRIFYRDLDQFKDSLELAPSGNIRIDYLYSVNNFQAIRFKRYAADGDQYVNRKGVLSRLKLEQDTVRLLIGKNLDSRKKSLIRYTPVQITFILNNYTDLRRITDSSGFQQMISVLAKASKPDQQYNNLYRHRTTIQYKPTAGKDSLNLRKGLYYGDEYNYTHYWTAGSSTLSFTGNIGVGLVKDRLSPMAELRAEVATPWGFGGKQRTVFALSTTPYFFFDNNSTQVNWFLNASAGSVHNGNLERSSFSSLEFGAGYLLKPVGNMFKGTTGKIFMNIGLPKNFSISPELIFTDNLRQVFPGITFKVFP